VLSVLGESEYPLSFSELARIVALPRSSLHNLCTALVEVELVERLEDGRFQVGWKVVELARSRLRSMSLVRTFLDVVDSEQGIPETIVLSVLRGDDVVYVALVLGSQRVAVRYDVGMRLPAAFTASGKAILSTLDEEEVRSVVGEVMDSDLVAGGPKTVEVLLAQLREARAAGFAIDDEETARGMICVGFPVYGRSGKRAIGAVAVSAIKDGHDFSERVERVRGVASRITSRMP
jgi:DNA-binding IclR family transcriptional regulator